MKYELSIERETVFLMLCKLNNDFSWKSVASLYYAMGYCQNSSLAIYYIWNVCAFLLFSFANEWHPIHISMHSTNAVRERPMFLMIYTKSHLKISGQWRQKWELARRLFSCSVQMGVFIAYQCYKTGINDKSSFSSKHSRLAAVAQI